MTESHLPAKPQGFHIHIDARHLPSELGRYVVGDLGFEETNFSGHPEGFAHFEPKHHLTRKLHSRREFDDLWQQLESAADASEFVGYLEGEVVVSDVRIPERPYREIEVPFQIEWRRLTGQKGERFRQTEFHLVYRRESDSRLSERLLKAGLYGAHIPKSDGEYLVLTMQGFVRDVQPLQVVVRDFVEASGGAVNCTFKEERAIRHKLFGISSRDLPPIVDRVDYC